MSRNELAVWLGIAGAVAAFLVLGVLLGAPSDATWSFQPQVPALLMAVANRAPWS